MAPTPPAPMDMNAPPPPATGVPSATPDSVMAADAQQAQAKADAIAATAPRPETPYSVKAIERYVAEFNTTLDALLGGQKDLGELQWAAPEGQAKWPDPLPAPVFLAMVGLQGAVSSIAGGKFAKKYDYDPMEVTNDAMLKKVTAQTQRIGKDKAVAKAMQAPPEAESVGPPPGTGGRFSESDRAIMANTPA